jgi:hypothetical protein
MELKDYLHLYLGCQVEFGRTEKDKRKACFVGFADYHRLECRVAFRAGPEGRVSTFLLKPILRPLSDMTEEEKKEFDLIEHNGSSYPTVAYALAPCFKWLLEKHFDLFGLIEAGLAISASSLPKSESH